MPSFSDFTWENFPDYDVIPEELQFPVELQQEDDPFYDYSADVIPDSSEEPDQPSAGDSYQGTDPTAFSEQDGIIDEQEATAPDAQTLGQSDDPEAQEGIGDEAEGDDEDDTSDPALVDSGKAIDATDDVRYPEQGIDNDELTITEPESINPQEYSGPASIFITEPKLFDIAQELLDWQAKEYDKLLLELLDLRDQALTDEQHILLSIEQDTLDYIIDIDDRITNQFANFAFDLEDVELDGEDNDDLGDGFTTPSLLTEMADIIGGVDQDTYLTSFQWLNADDI